MEGIIVKLEGGRDGVEMKVYVKGANFKLGKCEFDLRVTDVDVSAVSGPDITVSLQAGASFGQETVTAEQKRKKLEFKRRPKPECCP